MCQPPSSPSFFAVKLAVNCVAAICNDIFSKNMSQKYFTDFFCLPFCLTSFSILFRKKFHRPIYVPSFQLSFQRLTLHRPICVSTSFPQAQSCVFNDSPVIHFDRSSGCTQHMGQDGACFGYFWVVQHRGKSYFTTFKRLRPYSAQAPPAYAHDVSPQRRLLTSAMYPLNQHVQTQETARKSRHTQATHEGQSWHGDARQREPGYS